MSTQIATASRDATARVWDAASGACVATLAGHAREVLAVAVYGDMVLSGSWDGTVRLWAVAAAERGDDPRVYARAPESGGAVRCVAFAPGGRTFASGSDDGAVRVWRSDDGAALRVLDAHLSWVDGGVRRKKNPGRFRYLGPWGA